ncbi:cytochrome P450 [Mycobacterium sp. Aquia_216]|uniref:cytochrome P450 n=1 Tax=Mycobacterium sp. Aquia_216 TaxID=2991729 RepID=UPI00227D5D50|nr:cytochrome P450 [Mycobacterium sp. Aquia_216]WAJ43280.1 cytochrome P450 [Mycobacterium sp. Aquia_216]
MGEAQAESEKSAAAILPHYNMWDPDHEKVKWDVFAHARRDCPVAHTDADGGGQYVVTRYEDVRRVLEDPQTFSSAGVAPRPSPVQLNPLDSDPPYQVDLRRILNPLFTRNFLLRFEPELRKNASELIGRFIDNGRFDFIREYAGPFVGNALSRVVFNEDDPEKMDDAAEVVVRVAIEATDEAFFELAVLAGQYIAEREANPVDRNDVLNAIATGTVDGGRPLTDEERLGVVTVLFLGGLDTTRGAMGSIAYHLAREPELEGRLRDPAWIRQDMDEFIRLESPVGCLGRTATRDVELGGVAIKKGEQLLVRFDSANRDEARFEDASELKFDVRRSSSAGFGLGIHRCLGSHFARIQIAIAFDELFKRVTNLRFADPGAEVRWAPGIANGPEGLELLFDVIG